LIVMLYHFFHHDAYFQAYVPRLITRGYLGVDVFFVLSGFVLALNYAHHFKSDISFARCKDFIIKRIARIYPLYIVITILFSLKYMYNFSGQELNNYKLDDFAACALMIQSWGFGFNSVAGATWSLSTEFFAYLVFPVLILFVGFARPIYAVAMVGVCTIFLYLVVSSNLGVSGPLDVVSSSSVTPILRCLAGFCLGLVAYRLTQMDVSIVKWLSSPALIGGLIIALLVAVYFDAHDLIVFALFPPIVLGLYYDSSIARLIFANRVVFHLGVVSYSLYLIHPFFAPVKTHLGPLVQQYVGEAGHFLTLGLVILLSWGFACLLYRLIEVPGRRYLQGLLLERRTQQHPVVPDASSSGAKST